MTASTATAVEAGRTCPYCRFPLKAGVVVERCGSCDSLYHDECWRDGGGCAVFGCAATATGTPAAPGRSEPRFPPPTGPPSAAPPPRPGGSASSQRAVLIAVIAVLAVLVAALGGYVVTSSHKKDKAGSERASTTSTPPDPTAVAIEETSTPEPTPRPTVDPQVRAKRAAQRIESVIAFSQAGRAAVRDGRYAAAVSNRKAVLRRLRAITGTTGRLRTAKGTLEQAMEASLASDIAYQNGTSAAASDAEATRLKQDFARQWAPVADAHDLNQYSPGDI